MKQFLVLAVEEGHRGEVLGAAARAFGSRAGWAPARGLHLPGPGFCELIAWSEDPADLVDGARGEATVILGRSRFDELGRRLTPQDLLKRVAAEGIGALAEVAAPQSVVLAFGDPPQLLAATDRIGISSVYHAAIGGVHAVASSSRLLAAILGLGLDAAALSALALLGEFAGTDTPFRGIRRLGSSQCVAVTERGFRVTEYRRATAPRHEPRDLDAAVRDGVAAVRAAVGACVAAYPEFAMELSGGLDSRVILAATLDAGHRPIEGLTLGESSHPDMIVAARLAAGAGLEHRRVDLHGISELSPQEALRLVAMAGQRRDYSGNCVSLGVLDWVEPQGGAEPRFSGQNGELARGFYYAFQPPWPRTTRALSHALVRWRLMANERAETALFSPEAAAAGERRATTTTQEFLDRTGTDWLTATDLLYLGWRMQRWIGSDWSAAAQTRIILAPFFDSRYIDWALGVPPRLKRGSRLLARVLFAIDPELARVPTAGDTTPLAMFQPQLADRALRIRNNASKVVVKVRQRLKDSARAPVGAPVLAQLALDAMVDERSGLEGVAALPFVAHEYVERLYHGEAASPPTVGLLAALRGLVLDEASRANAVAPPPSTPQS